MITALLLGWIVISLCVIGALLAGFHGKRIVDHLLDLNR